MSEIKKLSVTIASSSSANMYTVTFIVENGVLTGQCNCKAGKFNSHCKHLFGVASGRATVDWEDHDNYEAIGRLLHHTEFRAKAVDVDKLSIELRELQSKAKKLDDQIKAIQKDVCAQINRGVPVNI